METKGRELRGANWRRGFIEGVTNYSLFPVPEPGTIEFRARERNRATVSRSRGDFSPFFFPFFSLPLSPSLPHSPPSNRVQTNTAKCTGLRGAAVYLVGDETGENKRRETGKQN